MSSRRKFLAGSVVAAAALASPKSPADGTVSQPCVAHVASLCGEWLFRTDPDNQGTKNNWHSASITGDGWRRVTVPHTWQVEEPLTDYRGVAWYRRPFEVPLSWRESAVRVQFEAVFHTATVWVNGQLAGEHARKGYTAFTVDITKLLRLGRSNTIAVRVDSAFNQHMVPRGRSSDWANDGGIYRPVHLLVTPKTFVERVDVEALPDLANGNGIVTITAYVRNTSAKSWSGEASALIAEEDSPLTVSNETNPVGEAFLVKAGALEKIILHETVANARLWHFDHPHLYRLEFLISDGHNQHSVATTFGVRKLEIRDGGFHLNGERVRLMGVERMAGSNPEFGMAEPAEWIAHDHADLQHLNCIFTRVHWPQDKRVLEYCDRHGILMQSEVPAWGADTFSGMNAEPEADILENALEQLREMIARDFNHPSVVAWGLCNEIWGQNAPAYQFARRMLEEAKRLDPGRLCSYASNSLSSTPERDVSGLMDFVEANEYYGTWAPGTAADAGRYLDQIHAAFPGKPIVVSEYGYCACTPDRPEGDEQRMEILRTHDAAMRSRDFVAGAIFFCYNDYRTHVGDRGIGSLQQRVHGVVDIYGARKPSYELLRRECSPIEALEVERSLNKFHVLIKVRKDLPAYTLKDYKLQALFFGQGNIPVERQEVDLPNAVPGSETKLEFAFAQTEAPLHVQFDVLRPTAFSAYSLDWKP
jgi:beta-glucuronidase